MESKARLATLTSFRKKVASRELQRKKSLVRTLDVWPSAATAVYPWADILDGGIHQLIAGEDFTAKPQTFISIARSQAKRKGGRIRTRTLTEGDQVGVVIQYQAGTS